MVKKTSDLVFPSSPGNMPMYDLSVIDIESLWTIHNTHDPGIIKTDEGYYVFSTDIRVGGELRPGVMVRKSQDLIHWGMGSLCAAGNSPSCEGMGRGY